MSKRATVVFGPVSVSLFPNVERAIRLRSMDYQRRANLAYDTGDTLEGDRMTDLANEMDRRLGKVLRKSERLYIKDERRAIKEIM